MLNAINIPTSRDNVIHLPRKQSLIIKRSRVEPTSRFQHSVEIQNFDIQKTVLSSRTAELFKLSPCMVSWKTPDLIFQGCSPKLSFLANLNTTSAIRGKKDSDLPWGKDGYAELFFEEDSEVLTGNILTILGKYQFHDKKRMVLVKKIPIFNKSENIIGIFNYYNEFYTDIFSNIILILNEQGIETSPHLMNLIKSLFFKNDVSLSLREEECAQYLLQGLSSKEIGKILGISYRTVEIYLNSLKEKLNCNKTTSLIVKLIRLGYLP
jgi:DNA-binding CsgD family transcriptional regulator